MSLVQATESAERKFELGLPHEAGIIFMSIVPEISAQLFHLMSLEAVQRVTLAITEMPSISAALRLPVLKGFGEKFPGSPDLTLDNIDAFVTANLEEVARVISGRYLLLPLPAPTNLERPRPRRDLAGKRGITATVAAVLATLSWLFMA